MGRGAPVDVARHYTDYGMLAIVPVELACKMDSFDIITRTDWLLSPGASLVLQALKSTAWSVYGVELAPMVD
jgi:hypothetical protein